MQAGSKRRIRNFHEDIKDSEIYTELLYQIAPKTAGVNKDAMNIQDMIDRAEKMLEQAEKLKSRAFVTARDVVKGQERLNLAFVANLFNNNPALDPPKEEIVEEFTAIEETREEKVGAKCSRFLLSLLVLHRDEMDRQHFIRYNLVIVNTHLAFVDVPELDELPGSQSSGQLPLLRPLRRPHHIPGASQSRLSLMNSIHILSE